MSPHGHARRAPRDSRCRAGRVSHIGLTVSPIRDVATGAPHGVICLFTDLSEVMELEEQLRLKDSLARLGEMTAGIAHEFRNGLATIHGYSRLLDLERLRGTRTLVPARRSARKPNRSGADRHQLPELRASRPSWRSRRSTWRPSPSGRPKRSAGEARAPRRRRRGPRRRSGGSKATKCCCGRRSAISAATRSKPATARASRRRS